MNLLLKKLIKTTKIFEKDKKTVFYSIHDYFLQINGVLGKIRTCDPLLRRQMLYPAELRGQKLYKIQVNNHYRELTKICIN